MALLQLDFTVCVADVDEQPYLNEQPSDLVARLSRNKAAAVSARHPHAIVLGADTVVALDDEILGKPTDAEDAARMLRRLRQRPHHVYSGVTVCAPGSAAPLTGVSDTVVWMRAYHEAEMSAYIASGDPLDKAGAYGIQNAEFHPVERIEGCYAGVMGFPLALAVSLLEQAGVSVRIHVPSACYSLTQWLCCEVKNDA